MQAMPRSHWKGWGRGNGVTPHTQDVNIPYTYSAFNRTTLPKMLYMNIKHLILPMKILYDQCSKDWSKRFKSIMKEIKTKTQGNADTGLLIKSKVLKQLKVQAAMQLMLLYEDMDR